jgi:RNA polymerase sigma-70 factor (sigma-E family)
VRTTDVDADFTAFVAAHGRRLLHLAQLLTHDLARAEDLLQSVLVRTYVRWPHVRQHDPVGYVRRALVNADTDWRRRSARGEEPTERLPDVVSSEDPVLRYGDRDSVLRALATLTARERAVVALRYYEDLAEVDIAQLLGVSPGTVKSTCARALAKLRVAPELATPER